MQSHVSTVSTLPKPSRTLILPNVDDPVKKFLDTISDLIVNINSTNKEKETYFIECKNLEDSISLYNEMTSNDISCRYAHYRMFLRITTDTSKFSYNDFKEIIKKKLQEVVNDINIMYFKLYQKENRITGNGYIVIDKYEDLKVLIKNNYVCNDVSFQLLNFIKQKKNE